MRFFRRSREERPTALIVGLGNPGQRYRQTRHNVGFQVIEEAARRHGIAIRQTQCRARIGTGRIGAATIALARPMTFMNDSGAAIGPLMKHFRLEPARVLVVYDDLDLPLGRLRLRPGGSAGGHRGVKSIIAALGSDGFPRVRIGIGRPAHGDAIDKVLSEFSRDEAPLIAAAIGRAADVVECWLAEGVEAAMNRFNADAS